MKAINPHTGTLIKEFKTLSNDEITKKIELSYQTFQRLKTSDIAARKTKLKKLSEVIEERADKIGETITKEMGKNINESISEAKKAANHAKYLYEHLEEFASPEPIKTESKKSYVDFLPLGPIFVITPFNFPFWLAIKAGLPALAMGNTVLNKCASACPMTGQCLEQCFRDAGYEEGEYQSMIIGKEATEQILSNFYVRGVSFTGSTDGGSQVAELAGKYVKKSVMELGGCDPCVVMKDADMNKAVEVVTESRLRNDGQVCSAIKRVIVDESVYENFKTKLVEKLKQVPIGDPMNKENKVGPLGSERIYKKVVEQIEEGVKGGAKLLYGGKRPEKEECQKGYYIQPTVIECNEDNLLSKEEVFGPVFTLLTYKDEKDALRIANSTRYGLGGVIISEDRDNAEKFGKLLESGILSINENLKSDSRMPNGGIKDSGYGRDCGREGAREFVNVRSVRIS